ncbi:hypothetical protein F3Y22_tig00111342pilonHSYRG00019 [Hibiscus syriacus]|uniref:FBD domain-containing protein n=1 Tax=Hibiscus syriacus TaxID=106335 RepID=A0A6A2YNT8_HIBSY|nr:hypothetical protein F3Y22_tig00111342pilonHSYRG00019 [Hibiscus syriacus]
MQSVVEADIDIDPYVVLQADAMAVFTGISNVHSLLLSTRSLEVLLTCDPLPIFANLVELEIPYCPDHKECSISTNKGLETLLTSSPELEKHSFYQEFLCSLPEEVPHCLLFRLKVIEVSGFMNYGNYIEKAKYILKNGGALEKLTIRTTPNVSQAERLKISQALSGCPRKAQQCCVLVLCHSYCGCEIDEDDAIALGKWNWDYHRMVYFHNKS